MSDAELRRLERTLPRSPDQEGKLVWLRDKQSPPRLWLVHVATKGSRLPHLVSPAPGEFLGRHALLEAARSIGTSAWGLERPDTRCGQARAVNNALPGHEECTIHWGTLPERACKNCRRFRDLKMSYPGSLWQWQVAFSVRLMDVPCPDPRREEIQRALELVDQVVKLYLDHPRDLTHQEPRFPPELSTQQVQ